MRWHVTLCLVCSCSSAQWTDTFNGQDSRSVPDAGPPPEGGVDPCVGLASQMVVSPITVTFPGYGTSSSKIHVVTPSGACDVNIDTNTDGVLFASNAVPCAMLLAPPKPILGSATASGPNDLLFQWTYSASCTLVDDYALSRK
jgi:hypothetical protein